MKRSYSIILLSALIIFGCATTENGENDPLLSMDESLDIPAVSLQIGNIRIEDSFPESKSAQVESLKSYLAGKLSSSPYFDVVLSGQERALTGSIGRIGERYLLNLNMINFDSTLVESSASIDFLSMNEFDYAVDIAVLKLEGKEIFPGKSFSAPDFSVINLSENILEVNVAFPEVKASLGEDSRRVEGMLREVLEQGDYHMINGAYEEAGVVYDDFIQRFDQGFRGSLVDDMSYLREYAVTQKSQAEMLLNLRDYEINLEGIAKQADNGQYESAYTRIKELYYSMKGSMAEYPDIYGDVYNSIKTTLAGLYGKVIESSLITAQAEVDSEEFNHAWNRVNNILKEMEANGTNTSLLEVYNDIVQMKEEIKLYSRSMVNARTDEFTYNTGYYAFKGDSDALQAVFREYRELLTRSPFAFTAAHNFNKELKYYKEEFSIAGVDSLSAPALTSGQSYIYPARTGSYNNTYSQDIKAFRFPEAEREITLLYRFGSSFLAYMEEQNADAVEFNTLLDNKIESLSPYEEFADKRNLLVRNIDSLEDILSDYPDLFYSDLKLSVYGELYKNYQESNNEFCGINNDVPVFIDKKGFPVYLLTEESFNGVEQRFVTTLVYNNGGGYVRKTVVNGICDDISLFFDTFNNPVVTYEADEKLNIIKIDNDKVVKYPSIKPLVNRGLKSFENQYYFDDYLSDVFSIINIGFDINARPAVLMDNVGSLVQYTLEHNKWKMETLLDGNRVSDLLVSQKKHNSHKTNLFFNDSIFILSRQISSEGITWGGMFLIEYADGLWNYSELPAFDALQYSLLDKNSDYFMLDNRGVPGLLQNNTGDYSSTWIEKNDGQWFAFSKDRSIGSGTRTGRNIINTEQGPISLEILSYSYGGYFSNFGLGTSVDHDWSVVKEFQSQSGYNSIIQKGAAVMSNGYGDLYVFDTCGFVMGLIEIY